MSHSGHEVDTSEDAFSREKRMVEERRREYKEKRDREKQYVTELEQTDEKLKQMLDEKLAEIDSKKGEIISQVKKTSGKLKFTLKGSMVKDCEYLQMALQASRDRFERFESLLEEAETTLSQANRDQIEVKNLKEMREKFDSLAVDTSDCEKPVPISFLKISNFDTDLSACLDDPKKALSYQTEAPRAPEILISECVVSDVVAYIVVRYNENVRVKKLQLFYKEAMYKGMSEKNWLEIELQDFRRGTATHVLTGLQRGILYKMYAVASNDFGASPQSKEAFFRTTSEEIELRTT